MPIFGSSDLNPCGTICADVNQFVCALRVPPFDVLVTFVWLADAMSPRSEMPTCAAAEPVLVTMFSQRA